MSIEVRNEEQMRSKKSSGKDVLISAEHLKKSFDEIEAIKDISFQLREEENLAVMGKSGSGKSVLIKFIIGLLTPDGGQLIVLGQDLMNIHEKELNELRRSVGFLFQGGALYDSMTVAQNLKFPLRRLPNTPSESEIEDLVDETLGNVGLLKAKHKYPVELSGGMKKRIALGPVEGFLSPTAKVAITN